MAKKERKMTGSQFLALPDSEKERIWNELDAMSEAELDRRSKPLNAQERAEWREIRKKMGRGRPKLGADGVDRVSVSVEKSLLARADAFARRRNMKRSEMVSRGLELLLKAG